MRTPKQIVKDWLGISQLEDNITTLVAERDIDALLTLAEESDAETEPIRKGYDASI